MRLAQFTNTYHPVVSGVVRSINTFREALSKMGHQVFIFSQSANDYVDSEPYVFRYPSIELPIHNHFPIAIPISPFINKLLPSLKLDVIHAHHPFLLGQIAANKAEDLNIPLVFTFHTRYRDYSHYLSLNQNLVKDAIHNWLGNYMEKCQHIIVPSQSIKDLVENMYGIKSQVSVIPTGIDLSVFENLNRESVRREYKWQDDTILISVGRLAKEKNFQTLIRACAIVFKVIPNTRLVIIGEGEERRFIENLIYELDVTGRIKLLGPIAYNGVPQLLHASDLFCFASTTETQGLVTLEAMAAKLPVVAVKASGTSDLVSHGVEGFLTENNEFDLAESIIQILRNDILHRKMSEAAKVKAAKYNIGKQAEKLLEVYDSAIIDKKANRYVKVEKMKSKFKESLSEILWIERIRNPKE